MNTRPWMRVALVALSLSTGAGLLAYFLVGLSLPIGIAAAFTLSAAAMTFAWRRSNAGVRAALLVRARTGVLAGLLATGAYDLGRYALVAVLEFSVRPFDAFPRFGHLLLGARVGETAAWIAGIVYHLANSIGFAIAYCVLVARPNLATGIAYAVVLEALMLCFYPSWLGIRFFDEFAVMSVTAHVAYGGVLATVAGRRAR